MEVPDWAYAVPPVTVIGERFCVPYPMDLVVKRKMIQLSKVLFEVFDQYGNLLLNIDGGVWNLKMKRTLHDADGYPLLTLRGRALSFWHKWKAYEGESSSTSKIMFVVRQTHPLQIKKELDVFLANNHKNRQPDFHLVGAYTSLSFKVFKEHRLIAEVILYLRTRILQIRGFSFHWDCDRDEEVSLCLVPVQVKHSFTFGSFCKGKEEYKVRVFPEVDYAFIVALLVTLDENDSP